MDVPGSAQYVFKVLVTGEVLTRCYLTTRQYGRTYLSWLVLPMSLP